MSAGEIQDPELFRELSKPFASVQDLSNALETFIQEVYVLRIKHGIANVHVVALSSAIGEGGKEESRITNAHFGDPEKAEALCGWALAHEHTAREERVVAAMASGSEAAKGKPQQEANDVSNG